MVGDVAGDDVVGPHARGAQRVGALAHGGAEGRPAGGAGVVGELGGGDDGGGRGVERSGVCGEEDVFGKVEERGGEEGGAGVHGCILREGLPWERVSECLFVVLKLGLRHAMVLISMDLT